MTMDENNRTPNSQQNQSGTQMNQSGQDSGQSFGQSGQDGDRNFSQAGSSFNQAGQQGQSMGQSSEQGQAGEGREAAMGQAQQFDQASGQAGAGQSGAHGRIADQIREHMEVMGEDGQSVGRVDSVDGERIKLTRAESEDGQHHYIQCSDVAGIENDQVHLHAGARPLPGNDGS